MREFLHVDDMASASLHVMNLSLEDYQAVTEPRCSHINVGTGTDVTIAELAATMAEVTGYRGDIEFDVSKPDGAPRKLMDSTKLFSLGWTPAYSLKEGLLQVYAWFTQHQDSFRA
jgi:GDP-L-fucose synthase